MAETNLQKFVKHCKAGGIFYAIQRGMRYIAWLSKCRTMGIDCKKFSKKSSS
jgi:hypothetical protein